MKAVKYPAHGWLPAGANVQWQRSDQGQDFVTDWDGVIQAPGSGFCTRVGADHDWPNGFGPRYAYVWISTGAFGGHEFYIGHCSALVVPGEHFAFGHPLARADQGRASSIGVGSPFNGGWCELGEAFGHLPGAFASLHWYTNLIRTPLIIDAPDPILKYGDTGVDVLAMTAKLRNCGWLPRRYWHFNRPVHGAVVAFQKHHHLIPDGEVGPKTNHVLDLASHWCVVHHKKEV